jgi:phosphoglycolate phosphatase
VRWQLHTNYKFRMKQKFLIFDLDGTLIDSAPSIIASMEAAFEKVGIKPIEPLTRELIGPPLNQIFTRLLGPNKAHILQSLTEEFKQQYDEIGCLDTRVFSGVPKMLEDLSLQSVRLYIATNKRIIPTRKIIKNLGWERFFFGIYSLDNCSPTLYNKSGLLHKICSDQKLNKKHSVYVGDRIEDAEAAKNNDIKFLTAAWGYGRHELSDSSHDQINSPEDIVNAVKFI